MAKHVTAIKLTIVYYLPSIDKYDLCCHYILSINGVHSWFSEGKELLMAHIEQIGITFRNPFPNQLWIHQVYCLQPVYWYDLKQIFEEGKYCAYEVCKHHDCRNKNLGSQNELKSLLILNYLGIKMNLTSISLFCFFFT